MVPRRRRTLSHHPAAQRTTLPPPPTAPMAGPRPELIADFAIPCEPQISPDGRSVVYVLLPFSRKGDYTDSNLWIASTSDGEPPRQFTYGIGRDRSPQWSPDGSAIVFLSDRAVRGTAQLHLIATNGGEARPILTALGAPVSAFAWSPNGGDIAFTSADEPEDNERAGEKRDDPKVFGQGWAYARLRLVSLATNEVKILVTGERHVSGFVWSPDGAELAYCTLQTPAPDAEGRAAVIERISRAGGEPRLVCHFPRAVRCLCWSADGKTILFTSSISSDPPSSEAVYAVARSGGEPRHLAFGIESCVLDLIQPPGAALAAVAVAAGLDTQFHWLDPRQGTLKTIYATMSDSPSGDVAYWALRSLPAAKTILALVCGSGAQPWELCVRQYGGRSELSTLRRVTDHQHALAGLEFGIQGPFTWLAGDGLALNGVLVMPPHAPRGVPLPTIVLLHGGPYARWGLGFHFEWIDWAQWLAMAGYTVLMPNPRGGLSHGESFTAAVRGNVGGVDYEDVMAAVDAAVDRGIADRDRLGIGGWSQGGFMAAWAISQSARFKAAVVGAGISHWGSMVMESDRPDVQRALAGGAPWDGPGPHGFDRRSPLSFADRITTPVLILHGEDDVRVPLAQAVGLHRALLERDVHVQFVVYPREGHLIAERAHQIDLLRRTLAWFDRWLRQR